MTAPNGGGPDRHIVIYYVKPDRSEIYFCDQPARKPVSRLNLWSAMGDVGELRQAFAGFHPQVRHVLEACPAVHKWALVDRDPLSRWCDGNVTLLGDACHPMTPYMAQGAATAIEDAAVLARCLKGVDRDGVVQASPALRGNAKGTDVTRAAQFAHEYVAQGPHQSRLGL